MAYCKRILSCLAILLRPIFVIKLIASLKAITPSIEEIKKNPSSRSAKLRYVRKIKEGANFEEFLLKFKNLIEIENIGKKIC